LQTSNDSFQMFVVLQSLFNKHSIILCKLHAVV